MSTVSVMLKLLVVVVIGASAHPGNGYGGRIAEWTEVPAFDLVERQWHVDREPVFAGDEPTNTVAGAH
jgi:hypothetical protein